ncbi:ubiquitin-like protein, partial [Cadophora sp. DSE1049]
GMEIIIRSSSGKVLPITVSPEAIISNIKIKIRDSLGTPLNQQRLLFRGKTLDNSSTLDESSVSNMSLVYLALVIVKKTIGNIYNTCQIFVKILHGEVGTLDGAPYYTVHQIKETIQEEEGIYYWRQVLRFNGKVLGDEGGSLLSYDIYNGAILQLMVSPQQKDKPSPSERNERLARLRL